MTTEGRRGFITVDRHWLADQRLSDGALRLMGWLDSHTDEYRNRLHVAGVAKQLGWSRNKVLRAIENLEELELISTEQVDAPGARSRTKITLNLGKWTDRECVPKRDTAVVHDETHSVYRNGTPTTSNPTSEESNVGTPKPPVTTEAEVVPEWEVFFNHFWAAYPRKVGKPAARRAMKAKYSAIMRHYIVDGTRSWCQYWFDAKTEEQFIPHPATFLNQERYNDAPAGVPTRKLSPAEQAVEDWRLKQEAKEHIELLKNRDNL